jgi:hypothetical protein
MSEFAATQSKEQELANLKEKVLREILPTFRASALPKMSDDDVQSGVELLFELLAHRLGEDAEQSRLSELARAVHARIRSVLGWCDSVG